MVMKERIGKVMKKMAAGKDKQMKEKLAKQRQMSLMRGMSKQRRMKQLKDMRNEEWALLNQYHHLRKYRGKLSLTQDGPVKKMSEVAPNEKSVLEGAKVKIKKPVTETAKSGGDVAVPAGKPEAAPAAAPLSKMGPAHRRRNPP